MKKMAVVRGLQCSSVLVAVVLLSGCVATKVDLSKFRDADIKEAEMMPTKAQLSKQQRIKIVVFEAEELGGDAPKNVQLGLTLSKAVEKELAASGAEIVDRTLARKLGDELRLAESKGTGNYKGPDVAQYAIRGKINAAEYGATYNEASSYTNKKGKTTHTPASYSHSASVGGSVSIYELPGLQLVTTINVKGSASASDPREKANPKMGSSLLRSAADSAIADAAHEMKNLFAPKGYVVERRTDGEKSIFKILMGRSQGVKAEDKVVIMSLRKKTNPLTGVEQTDELPVVEAKVSDVVMDSEAWVVPEDKEASDRVRLGDFVKVKYEEKSFLAKTMGNFAR